MKTIRIIPDNNPKPKEKGKHKKKEKQPTSRGEQLSHPDRGAVRELDAGTNMTVTRKASFPRRTGSALVGNEPPEVPIRLSGTRQ